MTVDCRFVKKRYKSFVEVFLKYSVSPEQDPLTTGALIRPHFYRNRRSGGRYSGETP